MNTEEITIRVDAETAAAYRAADEQRRRKAEIMFALQLSPVREKRSIDEVFDELNAEMRSRGMDDAMVEELLKDLEEYS